MTRLTITQLSEDDRPREKMMKHGVRTLSNAELLAILIGSGNQEETAIELSQRILNDADNNLNLLGKYDLKGLMSYTGIGEAKAITIISAMELGRRRREEDAPERPVLNTSKRVYELMRERLADLPHEEFWALLLNRSGRVWVTAHGYSFFSASAGFVLAARCVCQRTEARERVTEAMHASIIGHSMFTPGRP